jgi:hypothetical protein
MPLAGFPIINALGNYRFPGGRYVGNVYELYGHVYKPLIRRFPPICSATCVGEPGTLIQPLPNAFFSHLASSPVRKSDRDRCTPTLVCCSMVGAQGRRLTDEVLFSLLARSVHCKDGGKKRVRNKYQYKDDVEDITGRHWCGCA